MKKLKLESLDLQADEILSRSQLKNVLGGSGGATYCTALAFNCGQSCSCPDDGSMNYQCWPSNDVATCICGYSQTVTTRRC